MTPASTRLYPGPTLVDLTALKAFLIDLAPGETRTYRTALEGFEEALTELVAYLHTAGPKAGVHPDVIQDFFDCNDIIARFDALIPMLAKLHEVATESRAHYEHRRQSNIGIIVDTARSTAHRRREKGLLAPFEKTIKYNGQLGYKSHQSRRKNKEKAKAKAQNEAPPTPPKEPTTT